jgi:hypothetical protein
MSATAIKSKMSIGNALRSMSWIVMRPVYLLCQTCASGRAGPTRNYRLEAAVALEPPICAPLTRARFLRFALFFRRL